jgi:hypothetical protein
VRPLHLLADCLNPAKEEGLLDQGATVEQVKEVFALDRIVDNLEKALLDLRLLAMSDGLDQELA